jgi:hypothetical protein
MKATAPATVVLAVTGQTTLKSNATGAARELFGTSAEAVFKAALVAELDWIFNVRLRLYNSTSENDSILTHDGRFLAQ